MSLVRKAVKMYFFMSFKFKLLKFVSGIFKKIGFDVKSTSLHVPVYRYQNSLIFFFAFHVIAVEVFIAFSWMFTYTHTQSCFRN